MNVVNVKRGIFILAGLLAFSCVSFAQEQSVNSDIIEPSLSRDVINVDIHSANWEITLFGGLVNIDQNLPGGSTNGIAGTRFAYHLNENFFVEASYALSFHDIEFTYYDAVIGYNFHQDTFLTSDVTAKTALFFVLGAGVTSIDGDADDEGTLVAGAGYRVMFTDNFSMRLDLRGHAHSEFYSDDDKAVDMEATLGLSYFF